MIDEIEVLTTTVLAYENVFKSKMRHNACEYCVHHFKNKQCIPAVEGICDQDSLDHWFFNVGANL